MLRAIARTARHPAALRLLLPILFAVLVLGPARAAPPVDPVVQQAREKVEANRSALDSLEGTLALEGLRSSDLDDLRTRLDPIRRELQQRADQIAPRLADMKLRLQELGPPPAADAPPEDPSVAADRERMKALSSDLDAVLKQNRALSLRADQQSDRISTRRRTLFADQLFERSISILDPTLWTTSAVALSAGFKSLALLATDWAAYASQREDLLTIAGLAVGAAAIAGAIVWAAGLLRRRLSSARPADGSPMPRLRAAREAVKVAVFDSLVGPMAALAAIAFLSGFDVVPPRAAEILRGLLVAVFIVAIGQALARALLAPGASWRRLPPFPDRAAAIVFRSYSLAVWALAIASFFNSLNRALFTPVVLTVLTSGLLAVFICIFCGVSLVQLGRGEEDEGEDGETDRTVPDGMRWVRLLLWVVLAVSAGALVGGYVSFATFLTARMLIAFAVLAGLYLLYSLVDAFFSEGLSETRNARAISKTLGLRQSNVEVLATLLSGILKLCLFALAGLIMAASWGTSSADLMDTVERASFGVRIGNTNITLWNVLYALVLLLLGVLLAQGLQRWIATKLLPRTGLEVSLQSSISTIIGYVGVIIAIAVAMGEIGLNLENIALVAGALSVGIGFGLQSIVSNFVSGLILLAERPIRVGDTINVKGEEGYVRRISVRATEIETFERATVIVPNSDLITGMVKNWTHSNTTGRVIVTVTVAFDADVELVRDLLVAAACDHPQMLQTPPPRVFITKFTDSGIVFDLRGVVSNVDYALTVKSDLHFSILARFRKEGVMMASQPWAALGRAPADLVPPPPAPEPRPGAA